MSTSSRNKVKNFSRRFRRTKTLDIAALPQTNGVASTTQQDKQHAAEVQQTSTNTSTSITPATQHSPPTASPNSSTTPSPALRPPLPHRTHSRIIAATSDFKLPDLPWLCGTWHITHSTLPLWRDKRNVRVTYTRLPRNRLDEHVVYQTLGADRVEHVRGLDTPKSDGAYHWRGKGWLKMATSRWEVLGWGGGGAGGGQGQGERQRQGAEEQWVIVYFARTMFTPAGVDVYSRRQAGLSPALVKRLRRGLERVEADYWEKNGKGMSGGGVLKSSGNEFGKLVEGLFEVPRDGGMGDIRVD